MDVRENMSSNQFKIGNDDKLKLEWWCEIYIHRK
jgi:hypothetical protein